MVGSDSKVKDIKQEAQARTDAAEVAPPESKNKPTP